MAWDGLPHPGNMRCCTHFPAVTLQRSVQPSAVSDHAHPSRQIGAPRGAFKGCWDSDLHSLGLHVCLFVGVVCVPQQATPSSSSSQSFCQQQTPDAHKTGVSPRPSD